MASNDENQSISVSMPTGVVAAGIVVGLAVVAAYLMSSKTDVDPGTALKGSARASKGFGKRMGLMTLITLIENDATRKVVVAVLRAMAKRS